MGRKHVTKYDPQNSEDKFYSKNRAVGRPGIGRSKRFNQYHRPRSTQYGDGAPIDFKPSFTTVNATKEFYNPSHLRTNQME